MTISIKWQERCTEDSAVSYVVLRLEFVEHTAVCALEYHKAVLYLGLMVICHLSAEVGTWVVG